jgi:(p)ppGpp synthase/HD superfamily hydrolase
MDLMAELKPHPILGDRFSSAVATAVELHAEQARKGTRVPYVSRVLSVCALVLEDGGDEEEAIGALLHDAAEDAGGQETLEKIRDVFGDRVAGIVAGCSDAMPALGEEKPPWRERKEAYLEHLRRADASVLRVSMADKLHNAREVVTDLDALGPDLWSRFNAGPAEQAWYYESLLEIFEERLPQSRHLPQFRELVGRIRRDADQSSAADRTV